MSMPPSSSSARAGAAPNRISAPSAPQIEARNRLFRLIRFSGMTTLTKPRNNRKKSAVRRVYPARSGRFCGTAREQGLIQQADNPGNDGYISEVKNIPVKPPIGGGY